MHSLLDVTKIADSLVFVLDSTEGWDTYGDYCLSCLFAQGLPSYGNYKSFFLFFLNLIDFVSDVPLLSPFLSPIFNLHSTGVSGCVRAPCEEEG